MLKHDLSQENYDIKRELKERKILESKTSWEKEFNKNPNPYAYDLVYYRWIRKKGKLKKIPIGYIELERSKGWDVSRIPNKPGDDPYWPVASFLKRKLYKPKRNKNNKFIEWTNKPKKNYKKTLYLKFNKDYSFCFGKPMTYIINNGKASCRSDGSYTRTYIELDWSEVVKGIENCMEMIRKFNP